jgi:hypothetical protein
MSEFVVNIRLFDTAYDTAVTSTATVHDQNEQLTGVFVWLTKHLQYLSNTVSSIHTASTSSIHFDTV